MKYFLFTVALICFFTGFISLYLVVTDIEDDALLFVFSLVPAIVIFVYLWKNNFFTKNK